MLFVNDTIILNIIIILNYTQIITLITASVKLKKQYKTIVNQYIYVLK